MPFETDPMLKLSDYGISLNDGCDPTLTSRLVRALSSLPKQLIVDCGINKLGFEDLGPSLEYYPNHGYYVNNRLVLNSQLVKDPTVYVDASVDKKLDTFDFILYHEMGHGWDEKKGLLSNSPDWLSLSGWAKDSDPGKVRLRIKDPEKDVVREGEWCYDPDAEFVRYYARTNPWDDFADTFSFMVSGLYGFIPDKKKKYFEAIL